MRICNKSNFRLNKVNFNYNISNKIVNLTILVTNLIYHMLIFSHKATTVKKLKIFNNNIWIYNFL